MREAAMSGRLEIELGRLAARHAAHRDIKRFGERMVRDHSRTNQRLSDIADRLGVSLPQQLEGRRREMIDSIADLRGPDFDRLYMRHMIERHEQDLAAFREGARHASDPDLRAFAADTLPILEEHLEEARQLRETARAQPPPGQAANR
jgi:putative membrane protein